jgi:protein TonB
MQANLRTIARLGTLFLVFLALPTRSPSGIAVRDGEGGARREKPALTNPAVPDLSEPRLYHLRFLRARLDSGIAGSALFDTHETIVPLSAREFWGRADQTEALREALDAKEIEPMPGVVVKNGASVEGGPHRFRTALGEELVDVSFQGEVLEYGWSRILLRAETDRGVELLDAALRVSDLGTVALVVPLSSSSEDALVIGVTPLKQGIGPDLGEIFYAGFNGVSAPELLSKVDPVYPESAKKETISGKVILQTVIRADGVPDGLVVLQMPEGGEWLAGTAVEAISKWRYNPATRNGVPVNAYFTIIMDFTLQ